ncbi:unnamed protein product, partial [Sphacelaria rigidula]
HTTPTIYTCTAASSPSSPLTSLPYIHTTSTSNFAPTHTTLHSQLPCPLLPESPCPKHRILHPPSRQPIENMKLGLHITTGVAVVAVVLSPIQVTGCDQYGRYHRSSRQRCSSIL